MFIYFIIIIYKLNSILKKDKHFKFQNYIKNEDNYYIIDNY